MPAGVLRGSAGSRMDRGEPDSGVTRLPEAYIGRRAIRLLVKDDSCPISDFPRKVTRRGFPRKLTNRSALPFTMPQETGPGPIP